MKKEELQIFLEKNNIPQMLYSLEGGFPNEKYCIEECEGCWHVYYSERGSKSTIGIYNDEESACDCMIKEILKAHRMP